MKYIVGTKVNMGQIFDEAGKVTPVTIVKALPNTVTAIKTMDRDGYTAIQVATGEQKESRVSKAVRGALGGSYKVAKEFRTEGTAEATVGDTVTVAAFEKGDDVIVSGTSKAKGFQGVVKRYNFKGGPRSHGQKHSEREPGSIGGGPGRAGGRVVKGMRMAGRTGGDTVTVKGLKVVAVDAENNLIYISGAVPGRRGTIITIVG